jgi:hypothetical protein
MYGRHPNVTPICAPIFVGNENENQCDVWIKDSSFAYEWVGRFKGGLTNFVDVACCG